MYSPREQFANQAVLRPKRIYAETTNKSPKPDAISPQSPDLNSIFKRLASNGTKVPQ